MRSGPLAGIVVVELTRYIAGPFAGRLLADLGADVIKVEAPDGDPMRWLPVGSGSTSPQFASYNRNKRSMTIDLHDRSGPIVLGALIAKADVFLHNLRPEVADRYGLATAKLARHHQQLIACAISGFGTTGPFSAAQGYDPIISGMSGLYAQLLGDRPERLSGPLLSDLLSGLFAAQSVLAGLVARSTTGRGQAVEISMLESVLNLLNDAVVSYSETGTAPGPDARQRRQHAFTGCGSDGLGLVIQVSEDPARWAAFTEVLDRPEWRRDSRFLSYLDRCTNFDDLAALVHERLSHLPRRHWLTVLAARDIACGPFNSVAEALVDEQVVATGLIQQISQDTPGESGARQRHRVAMVRPAGSFSGSPIATTAGPPDNGADTIELLGALDLPEDVVSHATEVWKSRRTAR